MQECAIVWFNRDLRIDDHKLLSVAAKHHRVYPLYVVEPELWQQEDTSERHYQFITEALTELASAKKTILAKHVKSNRRSV